ncbi:hypothetical protein XH86_36925 (plasmid) [Bradyrhizobium guangdongense]|nr:hypothetical protein X265_35860 [Bradyrhizobium guangdongense]QOZ64363.1 hypothetical protein XH86_36925 [Bradyrhizobium guangdongense]
MWVIASITGRIPSSLAHGEFGRLSAEGRLLVSRAKRSIAASAQNAPVAMKKSGPRRTLDTAQS